MISSRKLRKLNDLLGAQLGRNPLGEPLYSWRFSDDLTHFMQKIDPRTAKPVFVYECQCGIDKTVHEASCTLSVAKPVYISRPLCPQLSHQWVAVLWSSCGSPEEWVREYRTRLQYNPRGYLLPTNACLGANEEPDEAVTWELIHLLNKQRKKTLFDWGQETDDALALGEKRTDSYLDAAIGDTCTAFGHAKPGTRSGGISFPSTGQTT